MKAGPGTPVPTLARNGTSTTGTDCMKFMQASTQSTDCWNSWALRNHRR